MLYFVSTPIGNLEDSTLRAINTLREVEVIACEDTRKTGVLLTHFGIKKPLLAFYEHNVERAGANIVAMLREGKSVAVVSDAGTPSISDPGFTLVRRALQENLPLTVIPGPTAAIATLMVSGLPTCPFTFRGFAPRKSSARRSFLGADVQSPFTLIYYESPHRLVGFLDDALAVFGNRPAVVANDLTKLFERVDRGTLREVRTVFENTKARGEYTIAIAGTNQSDTDGVISPPWSSHGSE